MKYVKKPINFLKYFKVINDNMLLKVQYRRLKRKRINLHVNQIPWKSVKKYNK